MEKLLPASLLENVNNPEAIWLQVFLVIFITLLISFFTNRFIKRLMNKLKATKTPWDDALFGALRRPLRTIIWLVGITYAVEILYKAYGAEIFSAVGVFRDVGIVVSVGWFLLRFIKFAEKNIVETKHNNGEEIDQTTIDAISKLLRISVFITMGLIILQTLGFSISGVLAFGGVGGVAVGFAAKDLLANFFGALMIYFDRPFKIGDWVRSPDRNIEGTIEQIGWRQTIIRTFDKRPLYVPNSTYSTIAVENPSRMTYRRFYETIGVSYDDMAKVEKIVSDIKGMLQSHPDIDQNQTLIVNLVEFSASSVDIMIYSFTKTTDWIQFHEKKQDVMLKIAGIIEDNGAEMAFPTQTLHVASAPPEFAGLK
jgi:MscS family membrane protein